MPSGITKKDVWQIAETLVQKDEMPTIVNVRSQLGGGNPHTIASHLASWREEHIKEEMLFYTERELLMATLREMEQERVGLMEEIERLDAEIEKVRKEPSAAVHDLAVEKKAHERTKAQIKDYQQRLKEAQGNAEKLAEQSRVLQVEAAALKERGAHAEQLKAQVEKLQGELAGLTKAKTAGKEADLQGDARKLAQENQALQMEIATLKERTVHVEALKAQVEKLQGELASLARSKETEKEDKPSEPQDTIPTGGAKQEAPKEAQGAQKKNNSAGIAKAILPAASRAPGFGEAGNGKEIDPFDPRYPALLFYLRSSAAGWFLPMGYMPVSYIQKAVLQSLMALEMYSNACFNAEDRAVRALSEMELLYLSIFSGMRANQTMNRA
ncbi:MAG: hypothetical protein BECKG1743F_GA0114225_101574 [Candidatus Kentron sp. G]|nr:MAG: hypothetical protein BECKG1743F_GA0114225_101574 [Candidatus Kentron sp. G]